jgi:hypothetical protein
MYDFDVQDCGEYYNLRLSDNYIFSVKIKKNDASLDEIKEIANSLYPCYNVEITYLYYSVCYIGNCTTTELTFEQLIEFIKINNTFNVQSISYLSDVILIGVNENGQKKCETYPIGGYFTFDEIK